ncbi:MAG: DNA methyltransferase, partial [Candidatus Babeliales bacterium]
VGIDACPETVKNLKHMQVILNRDIYEKNSKIIYDAFEDWKTEEKFDLIFTSPPYFCKEIYGEDDKQSSKRYRTYDSWKSCFLEKLIEKSYNYLKKEGILIINIANIKIGNKYYLIADDTEKILKEKMNFVEKHEMIYKNIYNAMTKSEPIFVFKK